jgi:transcriptional regulator with XRE-family HTH domain
MDAATAIRTARETAGLSKRELARRAGTSPAAIVAYESGDREPTLPTLTRICAGANARLAVTVVPARGLPDRATLAHRLKQVLDLAEHLPRRRAARRLSFPPLR